MKISCKFTGEYQGKIVVDGKGYDFYSDFFIPVTEQNPNYYYTCSKIAWAMGNNLKVDSFNYSYLLSYFVNFSTSTFPSAGLNIIIPYLDMLDKIIKKNSVVSLDIEDIYPGIFKQCARLVCRKKKAKLRVIRERYKTHHVWFVRPKLVKALLQVRLGLRLGIGKLRKMFGYAGKASAKVILFSNMRFSKHNEKDNLLFGNILSKIKESKIIRYEVISETSDLIRYIRQHIFESTPYIGDFYSIKHFVKMERDFNILKQKWESGVVNLDRVCVWKGYKFRRILQARLDFIFKALSYIVIDARYITQSIINKTKVKVVVIDHEENMYGKAFILNLKHNRDKFVVALAHELIYPGCVHTFATIPAANDIKNDNWRPLPAIKFAPGNYAKDVLIKYCNYPKSKIKVTGNPKYDFILNGKYNKGKLIKHNYSFLSMKRPIILYACGGSDLKYYPKIKELADALPGYDIIVKPHPYDDEKEVLKVLKQYPNNLKVMKRNSNIYELLALSDYVVTTASSVGFEAMLMKKPLFIYNPTGKKPSGLPYLASGACIAVNKFKHIAKHLKEINSVTKRAKRNKFIKTMHRNDGKATERVVIEIKKLLGERK